MIYFKVTDPKTEAWKRVEMICAQRDAGFEKLRELKKEYGIVSGKVQLSGMGGIRAFEYKKGQDIPKGFRANKNTIVPDKRYKEGKKAAKQIESIHLPDSADNMETLLGASGEHMTASKWYRGIGMFKYGEIALFNCQYEVLEDAKSKTTFDHPSGLIEITGTEYQEIKSEAKQKREAKKSEAA